MISITQLRKLKGKGLRELRVRGLQEMHKLGERALGIDDGEMSDEAFGREIRSECFNGSIAGTAVDILQRIRAGSYAFFPSIDQRESVAAIMERRFPNQRQAVIDTSLRAIRGEFDLMEYPRISFGDPIDWHLEPLSGKRAPFDHWSLIDYLNPQVAGDKKIIWELSRHQHFVTFGQAYWVTGDERFAEAFVSQVESWMDANPPKRGINWASSLEVAFRSISWLWALHLLADSKHLTGKFLLRLLKHLIAHGCHIESYLSHYFSPNTHLTGEALGLVYLGFALPELRRARGWLGLGTKILLEQLPRQVSSDGVYFEQSTYYHRYTTDFYTHFLLLARANSIELPAMVESKLVEMIDYVMWITHPDGSSPLIGDDDGGRLIKLGERNADDFRDTLATGVSLFERSDWKYVAASEAVETLWLLGPQGLKRFSELDGRPLQKTSRAFDVSGYYVMRDGWSRDASQVIVNCNRRSDSNCAHAHADALAFEFVALGKVWLIDPGTFIYTGNTDGRNYFRSTSAHNTATVDGESQSLPAGPFSWIHRADAQLYRFISEDGLDYFEGSHNGYERLLDPVTHRRTILFAKRYRRRQSSRPSYLVIRDRFTAHSNHNYTIRYHLSPECAATAYGNQVKIAHCEGDSMRLLVFGTASVQASIEKGWVSRGYGHRESSLVVAFSAAGEAVQQFTTMIIPSRGQV